MTPQELVEAARPKEAKKSPVKRATIELPAKPDEETFQDARYRRSTLKELLKQIDEGCG